ncbi:MAG: hypothetical protein LUD50_01215 [Clostridia bacterium]|nr:hypothetical protein [Clostridia bacterium]
MRPTGDALFTALRYGRRWRVYCHVTHAGTPRYEPVGGAIYDTEREALAAARKLGEAALTAIRNISEKYTENGEKDNEHD